MKKLLLNRFVAALTAILGALYAYLAWRLASGAFGRTALAVPFLCIWLVPVVYWINDRQSHTWIDEAMHVASYLGMGWLSFAILFTVARDVFLFATSWPERFVTIHTFLKNSGASWVLAASGIALGLGMLAAFHGPHIRRVDIPVVGLATELEGLRIVQISDLHIGPTIRTPYIKRVVKMANELRPDLVALTGDMVDGPVGGLSKAVFPLSELRPIGRVYMALGNHDYYSGARSWIDHFRSLGVTVLLNEYAWIEKNGVRLVIGGVVDPAAREYEPYAVPRPDLAAAPTINGAFRLLLAHNPKIAPTAEQAGFDLQLSGHTHAGQFFPWTLAVRWLHAPHVAGLSRCKRMWVYVSPGTGTWGPPVRFGTEPELTLIRLIALPAPQNLS